jgi:hypothetical protein
MDIYAACDRQTGTTSDPDDAEDTSVNYVCADSRFGGCNVGSCAGIPTVFPGAAASPGPPYDDVLTIDPADYPSETFHPLSWDDMVDANSASGSEDGPNPCLHSVNGYADVHEVGAFGDTTGEWDAYRWCDWPGCPP